MATYIGKNSDGFLTYKNEPNSLQTLLKNINDVYPESELQEITAQLAELEETTSAQDVSEDITLSAGSYTDFTLLKAVKIANVLYIQLTVTPTTTLSAVASATIIASGFKPALLNDSRIGFGFTQSDIYLCYMAITANDVIQFRIKKMGGSTWPTTDTVGITLIIPTEE